MKTLLFLIVACGPNRLHVAAVDPDWAPTYEGLRADLKSAGHDILIDGPGITITVSAPRVAAAGDDCDAAAFWTAGTQEVVMPPRHDWVVYPNGQQTRVADAYADVLLAHELGHAMGLQHMAAGLMAPLPAPECIGRAAACLIEALSSEQRL